MTTWCPVLSPRNRPSADLQGCVPYAFDMAREQTSNDDWCAFLNDVEARTPGAAARLGLCHKDMADGVLGGIDRADGRFVSKPGWGRKPVVYVRYEDVCRYCNWLQTGDTETGAYDMSFTPPRRRVGAKVFIPTLDEWTKAAYYDPKTLRWLTYPTGDELPSLREANYERGDELAVGAPFYFADVGDFADAPSPCGCVQMVGNAWELLEDVRTRADGSRVNLYKGGSFGYTETGLSRLNTDEAPYNGRCYVFGFRLAGMKTGWHPCRKPLLLVLVRQAQRVKGSLQRRFGESRAVAFLKTVRNVIRTVVPWLKARRVARTFARSGRSLGDRALVVPCDPWSVNGSRGDEAMLLATRQQIRARDAKMPIDILTAVAPAARDELRELGFVPQNDWPLPLHAWAKSALARYRVVYVLGADVMDGVYGWWTAWRLLAFADVCSRAGIETHLLGFSWSMTPSPLMRLAFALWGRRRTLFVRDGVSLERVRRFAPRTRFELVADAAFLLEPRTTPRAADVVSWIRAERAAGRVVVAVNVHPMFNSAQARGVVWEEAFAAALNAAQKADERLVLLLVPHDNRPGLSDEAMLARIEGRLAGVSRRIGSVWHADELKAVVGACDGLVAGRMHISIAALSQGVPVLGLVYQGKFEGLWRHCGLDAATTCLRPETFVTDPPAARAQVEAFLALLPTLRETLRAHLPDTLRLARLNYERGVELT